MNFFGGNSGTGMVDGSIDAAGWIGSFGVQKTGAT